MASNFFGLVEASVLFVATSFLFTRRQRWNVGSIHEMVDDTCTYDNLPKDSASTEKVVQQDIKRLHTPFPWEPTVSNANPDKKNRSTLVDNTPPTSETIKTDKEDVLVAKGDTNIVFSHQLNQLDFIASMTFAGGLRQPNCPCCV